MAAGEPGRHDGVGLDRLEHRFAVAGRRSRLARQKKPRAELCAGGAQRQGCRHTAAVDDPACRHDGHRHRIHDLRHERERSDERHVVRDVERRSMPARLGALRNHEVDPRGRDLHSLLDGGDRRPDERALADESRRVAEREGRRRARRVRGRTRPARRLKPRGLARRESRPAGRAPRAAGRSPPAPCRRLHPNRARRAGS